MSEGDRPAGLAEALERVVVAARAHLAAVTAAGGTPDDPAVWRSYLLLNNVTYAYDELMLETYGEVTPWDTDPVEPPAGQPPIAATPAGEPGPDPHPPVVSVRQRRDYRVPSVAALLAVAAGPGRPGADRPGTVAEAVLELVGSGDWSLASLDLPELEPLAGVVAVVESPRALPPEAGDPALFQVGAGERQVGRRDERPFGGEDRPAPAGAAAVAER